MMDFSDHEPIKFYKCMREIGLETETKIVDVTSLIPLGSRQAAVESDLFAPFTMSQKFLRINQTILLDAFT